MQAQLHALLAVVCHGARDKVVARPVLRHLHTQRRHVWLPCQQACSAEVARRFPLDPHVVELRVVREHLPATQASSQTGRHTLTAPPAGVKKARRLPLDQHIMELCVLCKQLRRRHRCHQGQAPRAGACVSPWTAAAGTVLYSTLARCSTKASDMIQGCEQSWGFRAASRMA